jgi:hypothetical protein
VQYVASFILLAKIVVRSKQEQLCDDNSIRTTTLRAYSTVAKRRERERERERERGDAVKLGTAEIDKFRFRPAASLASIRMPVCGRGGVNGRFRFLNEERERERES